MGYKPHNSQQTIYFEGLERSLTLPRETGVSERIYKIYRIKLT